MGNWCLNWLRWNFVLCAPLLFCSVVLVVSVAATLVDQRHPLDLFLARAFRHVWWQESGRPKHRRRGLGQQLVKDGHARELRSARFEHSRRRRRRFINVATVCSRTTLSSSRGAPTSARS
ncbi:unnamed protein product [Prorocentrum cordatum]|uniref:Secreted protein n=1 Tax=Prorocentrum cordatum TaxID=2364126 RepID=A0ABN9PDQ2_9DINO|nr:unnamed protein product [Polarella glacialis]